MIRRGGVNVPRQWLALSLRAGICILVLGVSLGCFKRSIVPEEPDTIVIRVSNNNPLDMTVYAVNQSMRVRLGTISSASTQRFTVSLRQVSPTGDLQLLADPVGSRRTMTSETIHVFPGQAVEWILQADLRQSSLTIRS
jgi:hypothetical protein